MNDHRPQDGDHAHDPQIAAWLEKWPPPQADAGAKARVNEALLAAFDAQHAPQPRRAMNLRWGWLIVRAQLRVVNGAIWIVSALILALGVMVSVIAAQSTPDAASLPLVIIAPLVAGIGAAFLYGEEIDPPLEIHMTTPIPPAFVLLARLALLFGFNLALALLGSLILSAINSQVSLVPLIAAWLAPMSLLSALAFTLSVLLFDARLSIALSLSIWVVISWRRFAEAYALPPLPIDLPDILNPAARPLLVATAALIVICGLWIADREERHLRS